MVAPGGPPLGGRYELQSLLATGGMGQVWCARDVLLHRPVAVKLLRSEYTGDPTFLARFRVEAQHAALLAHRNIAAVFDYGEIPAEACGEHGEDPVAYLVMELVDGEALSAVLAREGRLGVPQTLELLRQTAAGLAAAHAAGVVHRDVKPGNLLVGADGVVRITDFGVAWSASDVPLTRTGEVVGTAQYLAPEQAEGGKAGPAGDVYALGLIGYECLAGRRAFDGGTPVQIALRQIRDEPEPLPDDVPEAVRTLIGRALRKSPEQRYPDGAAFRDAVDDVLAGRALPPLPTGPPTATLVPGLPGGGRRLRRVAAVLAALVVGAAIGGGVLQLVTAPPPVAPAVASAAPTTGLVLRSADLVGRPADEVEAELAALGLTVSRTVERTAEAPPGTVLGVGPVGSVRPGSLITLVVAAGLPAPSSGPPSPEPESALVEAGASPPAPAPAPVPAVAAGGAAQVAPQVSDGGDSGDEDDGDEKGNGNGNGRGNGNGNGRGNGNGHGKG